MCQCPELLPPHSRQVEVPRTEQLLSQLEEMSCTCEHRLSYTSAAKCFAGLVNKEAQGEFFFHISSWFMRSSRDPLLSSSGDSLDRLIEKTTKRVGRELESPASAVRAQAFTLMVWVRVDYFFIVGC